jgi:hypothetical protein
MLQKEDKKRDQKVIRTLFFILGIAAVLIIEYIYLTIGIFFQ